MISCRAQLVTMDETWLYYYDPETKQQSMEWRHSGSPRCVPKKNPSTNIRWISSRLYFLGSRWLPPHWLSSKGPNCQRGVLIISAGAIERHFKEKTSGISPRVSCPCTTMPRLTGHLQLRRNWPTFTVLITHPILRIWPRRTTICSLDWKKTIERSLFFIRRGSNCCRGDLVGRTTYWIFFLSGLHKLEQRAKKCIALRGEYVE